MPQRTLKVKLVGSEADGGLVRLDDFTMFCRAVAKCLRHVDEVVHQNGERLRYRVVEMEAASASLTLEAVSSTTGEKDGESVFTLFSETVSRLQAGRAPDRRLAFDDIDAFRDLLSPLGRHASEVWVDDCRLTTKSIATIEKILGSAIPSRGNVTGCLERLNLHGRYEFVLFPVAGSRIVCVFNDALIEEVRKGIKRTVTVSGMLFFRPDRPLPDRVHVEKIEIHPADDSLPRLRSLKGISPRCTGKRTSVEFVRAIRDE
jgi:hypothetical protein